MIKVFIQNEAGSDQKHYQDEKALKWKRVATVSHPYPFPYGFIVDTTAEDGCNVDCFVITTQKLRTGQIVECQPVGLMEQIEDGQSDHNVLAILRDEDVQISEQIQASLTEHVLACFQHVEGKDMTVGKFLGAKEAEAHIAAHQDLPTLIASPKAAHFQFVAAISPLRAAVLPLTQACRKDTGNRLLQS